MTTVERIRAVTAHGFTERQARFLVMVMQYSGVCLPRQFAAFAGITYGDKTWTFFERLVQRRYAIPYRCRHHRARIYHVRYKPLYRAIGNTDSRHRRSMSAALVIERLTLVDALIGTPSVTWLTSPEDRHTHFAGAFPEALSKVPVGVEPDGRIVLLLPFVNGRLDDFRVFLQRCAGLLSALSRWTIRVALAPHSRQYGMTGSLS